VTRSGRRPWSIAARSAFITAAVVFAALAVAGAGLSVVLYRSLLTAVDDGASARVRAITSGLHEDPPTELDDPLLATDQRIVAIQVVDPSGTVVRRSDGAPAAPLVAKGTVGPTLRVGMTSPTSPDNTRISGRTIDTPSGRWTVLVAGDSDTARSTVINAALVLLGAAPVVIAVAAVAAYRMVRRSLRSVDSIRAQVAEISASDLAERVPVPPGSDEIAALAVTMNEMLARIEAGHAAQRRFVGDASHELRSPLTAIISALDVAVAHPELLDLELAKNTLAPEAQRMRTLVEDLLLLARADEMGLALQREPVRLDDIARSEVIRLRRTCPHVVEIDTEPVELEGDRNALSRVVRNLLDNAARHAASRIDVAVHPKAAHAAVLTVADDGPGIPPADRIRALERFVRLDDDRSRTSGGSGLGLSIALEIVTAHMGEITISDRPGGGTVMSVQLPLENSPDSSR